MQKQPVLLNNLATVFRFSSSLFFTKAMICQIVDVQSSFPLIFQEHPKFRFGRSRTHTVRRLMHKTCACFNCIWPAIIITSVNIVIGQLVYTVIITGAIGLVSGRQQMERWWPRNETACSTLSQTPNTADKLTPAGRQFAYYVYMYLHLS